MGCTASASMGPTSALSVRSLKSGVPNLRFTPKGGVEIFAKIDRPDWLADSKWMHIRGAPSMRNLLTFDVDEAMDALETFCTQAATGTIMAFIKEGTTPSVSMLKAQMVTYLNRVYTDILTGENDFVQETFAKFGDHSPSCTMWLILEVVWIMIEMIWVNGKTLKVEQEIGEIGMDRIFDETRAQLNSQMVALFKQYAPSSVFEHICKGPTIEELREKHDSTTPFFEVRACAGRAQKVKGKLQIVQAKPDEGEPQLNFELDEDEQQACYTEDELDNAMSLLADLLAEKKAAAAVAGKNEDNDSDSESVDLEL